MANYQELLSKAVEALPENNGASRRDVYEKARKALVAQLRAINPPLPAREITQHRLELEDCIREVEHNATEALLGGLKDTSEESIPVSEPEAVKETTPAPDKNVPGNGGAQDSVQGAPESKQDVAVAEKPALQEVKEVGAPKKEPVVAPEVATPVVEETATPAGAVSENEAGGDKGNKESGVEAGAPKTVEPAGAIETDKQSETLDDIIAQSEQSKAQQYKSEGPDVKTPSAAEEAGGALAPDISKPVEPVVSSTRESDKGIGAAMSRVREVENDVPPNGLKGPVISPAVPRGAPPAGMAPNENGSTLPASVQGSPLEGADAVDLGKAGPTSGADMSDAELLAQKLTGGGRVERAPAGEVQSGDLRAGDFSADSHNGGAGAGVDRIEGENDAQSVVDRAIQTLDREARGEGVAEEDGGEVRSAKIDRAGDLSVGDVAFSSVGDEEQSSGGLTIFLVLVILLLGAVGGGGYWAWKEGYVDLDSIFASSGENQGEVQTAPEQVPTQTGTPIRQVGATGNDEASGPGNTATDVEPADPTDPNVALEDPNKTDERLVATQDGADAQTGNVAQPNGADDKIEDRLGAEGGTTDPSLTQEGDPASAGANASAQSLLLEASTDGNSGAVPFSGTVEWSRGVDELGEPTLIGQANIPARNMKVKVLIRRNGDASLPASHLMEIDFDVSETFVGGAVAGLPGILLKNEELVQGVALVGASARVVGNSFLFALSAADQDIRTNLDLLENRKWMDLALIYASGNRAIITLEKDDAAQALFRDVMAQWQAASGGGAPDTSSVVLDSVDGAAGATDLLQDSAAPASN